MSTDNSTHDYITIQTTKGQSVIISPIDADLARLKWQATRKPNYQGGGAYHAKRTIGTKSDGTRQDLHLHRIILERMIGRKINTKVECVDHINGDPSDNRRENLRLATHSQNKANTAKQKSNTSGYKGVSWKKDKNKWHSRIVFEGKIYTLGYFNTPEEAYAAYCAKGREIHGEFFNPG